LAHKKKEGAENGWHKKKRERRLPEEAQAGGISGAMRCEKGWSPPHRKKTNWRIESPGEENPGQKREHGAVGEEKEKSHISGKKNPEKGGRREKKHIR